MIYLDNAATSSPKPDCVLNAVISAMTDENANAGRAGHTLSLNAGRRVLQCREAIAKLINAEDPFSITFTYNCTDALNLAIKGCIRRGDHVISTMLEHNSVLRPLIALQAKNEIALTLVQPRGDGFIYPDDIKSRIVRNTRLIVMTQASNVTGGIQPCAAVGEIARENGILYLIDGAQALGIMPVDVNKLKCDMYAFAGHKGLLGPQGTGGLYIKSGLVLNPLREGGTGSSSESMIQPSEIPERYESGTLNFHGIAGLGAGAEYVSENLYSIFMMERELTTALYEELSSIKNIKIYSPARESERASIVTFNIGDLSSSEAADALNRMGFAVRGGLHCAPGAHRLLGTLERGAVRASIGHTTAFDEIDRFVEAVKSLV